MCEHACLCECMHVRETDRQTDGRERERERERERVATAKCV